jgi:hypothetical protein
MRRHGFAVFPGAQRTLSMRNLLAFVAALALAFFGAGWYLGWYKVQNAPSASGHRSVNIDFNTKKIEDDLHKEASKISRMLDKKAPSNALVPPAPGGNIPSPPADVPVLPAGNNPTDR